MQLEEVKVTAKSNPSQRIIAAAIIFAFLYYASDVVVTLLLAALAAYFLDPVVSILDRIHIPRGLGALVVLLGVSAIVAGLGYLISLRANQFLEDWPAYSAELRNVTTFFDRKLTTFEKNVQAITPTPQEKSSTRTPPRQVDPPPVREWLVRGAGSLYSLLVVATFVPFLIFFMLAAKTRLWTATIELFPNEHRAQVRGALEEVGVVLRRYVAGNALVALILMLASWGFFSLLHLKNPFFLGAVSGVLNVVPYLGAVLSWIPPMLIGLTQWTTVGPYIAVAATLMAFHIIGLNILVPAIVGKSVHLNALAVTASLLFWGWMWGAAGLILAIPIMATLKVICDHSEGWEAAGRWLGE